MDEGELVDDGDEAVEEALAVPDELACAEPDAVDPAEELEDVPFALLEPLPDEPELLLAGVSPLALLTQ